MLQLDGVDLLLDDLGSNSALEMVDAGSLRDRIQELQVDIEEVEEEGSHHHEMAAADVEDTLEGGILKKWEGGDLVRSMVGKNTPSGVLDTLDVDGRHPNPPKVLLAWPQPPFLFYHHRRRHRQKCHHQKTTATMVKLNHRHPSPSPVAMG